MKLKGLVIRLSLMLTSALCTFLLLEVGLRLGHWRPQQVHVLLSENTHPTAATVNATDTASVEPTDFHSLFYEDDGVRRMRPNRRFVIYEPGCDCQREIKTNRFGFRNPEIGQHAATRYLFLGDSITAAFAVPEEKTWLRLLEQRAKALGQEIEAINASVSGSGLANHIAILSDPGLSLKPDVVVLQFYLNDVETPPAIYVDKIPQILAPSWLAQHLFFAITSLAGREERTNIDRFIREQHPAWKAEIEKKFPHAPGDGSLSAEAFMENVLLFTWEWGSAWAETPWSIYEPLFSEFKRLSEQQHFTPVVIISPVIYQVYSQMAKDPLGVNDYPQRRLKKLLEDIGLPLIDLLPYARKEHFRLREMQSNYGLFTDWCHYSEYGNRMVAEWLQAEFQRIGLLKPPA